VGDGDGLEVLVVAGVEQFARDDLILGAGVVAGVGRGGGDGGRKHEGEHMATLA